MDKIKEICLNTIKTNIKQTYKYNQKNYSSFHITINKLRLYVHYIHTIVDRHRILILVNAANQINAKSLFLFFSFPFPHSRNLLFTHFSFDCLDSPLYPLNLLFHSIFLQQQLTVKYTYI